MIDLGWLGQIAFTWEFLVAVMSIVLIDLVLAGDNAVVIAMAVKNLQGKDRQMGIILGAGGAVVIRVICTFLVAQLLNMSFVKLIGGAVIIWIAVKLLTEGTKEECHGKECSSVWQALWIIIVADLSMGIDNMLAVGAASHGNLFLLLFGLLLSIPMVVFMSTWLSEVHGPLPDHPVDRRGGAGQGGRRNDDHRPLGERAAQPAEVERVCRDGLLRIFCVRRKQMADQQSQAQSRLWTTGGPAGGRCHG